MVGDLNYVHNSEEIFQGSILYNDEMYSVRITQSPPSGNDKDGLDQAEGGNDDDGEGISDRLYAQKLADSDNEDGGSQVDRDEERELPKTFQKAKPFGEHRENKFTSTLRRLSTIRKRNKTKRKKVNDKSDDHDDSSAEFSSTPPPPFMHLTEFGRRPSSTTSRDSEGEALTSGYFR
jgi:hypothetical protein